MQAMIGRLQKENSSYLLSLAFTYSLDPVWSPHEYIALTQWRPKGYEDWPFIFSCTQSIENGQVILKGNVYWVAIPRKVVQIDP